MDITVSVPIKAEVSQFERLLLAVEKHWWTIDTGAKMVTDYAWDMWVGIGIELSMYWDTNNGIPKKPRIPKEGSPVETLMYHGFRQGLFQGVALRIAAQKLEEVVR